MEKIQPAHGRNVSDPRLANGWNFAERINQEPKKKSTAMDIFSDTKKQDQNHVLCSIFFYLRIMYLLQSYISTQPYGEPNLAIPPNRYIWLSSNHSSVETPIANGFVSMVHRDKMVKAPRKSVFLSTQINPKFLKTTLSDSQSF